MSIQYTKDSQRNGVILTKYSDSIDKRLVLPETVDGLPLIEIGHGVFGGHKDLEEIILPDTVVTIGRTAFLGCEKLKRVILPEKLKKIEKLAFAGCQAMEECIIPESVTEIQMGAFSGAGLASVTIPASCVSLGEKVFLQCWKLKSIMADKENPVYESFEGALYDKKNKCLLSYPVGNERRAYTVQDGTEKIEELAFMSPPGGRYLRMLVLPGSLKKIVKDAFGYTKLQTVWFNGTEKDWLLIEGSECVFYNVVSGEGELKFRDE